MLPLINAARAGPVWECLFKIKFSQRQLICKAIQCQKVLVDFFLLCFFVSFWFNICVLIFIRGMKMKFSCERFFSSCGIGDSRIRVTCPPEGQLMYHKMMVKLF